MESTTINKLSHLYNLNWIPLSNFMLWNSSSPWIGNWLKNKMLVVPIIEQSCIERWNFEYIGSMLLSGKSVVIWCTLTVLFYTSISFMYPSPIDYSKYNNDGKLPNNIAQTLIQTNFNSHDFFRRCMITSEI